MRAKQSSNNSGPMVTVNDCDIPSIVYIEKGVWRGATILAKGYGINPLRCGAPRCLYLTPHPVEAVGHLFVMVR